MALLAEDYTLIAHPVNKNLTKRLRRIPNARHFGFASG